MKNKHYWAIYYGIDETLPDDEFYCRVKEINRECKKHIKNFQKGRKYGGEIMNKKVKALLKAGAVRAIRTVAQTALATIGTATLMGEVNWGMVASASLLAGVISILMSLAGLPEVKYESNQDKSC